MKTEKEIKEQRERLVKINENAPYDPEMFQNLTIQINILDWVLN